MAIIVTWCNQTKCCVEENETDAASVISNIIQHGSDPAEIVVYRVTDMSSVKITFDWIAATDRPFPSQT